MHDLKTSIMSADIISAIDFKNAINEELSSLVGVDVLKNGGINNLVNKSLEFLKGNFQAKECRLMCYCPALEDTKDLSKDHPDSMYPFATIHVSYKEDKRCMYGIGYKIKSIWMEYDIDLNKLGDAQNIWDIPDIITYDKAMERKDYFEKELMLLKSMMTDCNNNINKYDEILHLYKTRK